MYKKGMILYFHRHEIVDYRSLKLLEELIAQTKEENTNGRLEWHPQRPINRYIKGISRHGRERGQKSFCTRGSSRVEHYQCRRRP